MQEYVTFDFFQWFFGLKIAAEIAVCGWIGREILHVRRVLDAREEQRKKDLAAFAAAANQAQEKTDNDLTDLWQVMDRHATDAQENARLAASFRERTAEQLGDIKAALATLNARLMPPMPPMPPMQTAPGDD